MSFRDVRSLVEMLRALGYPHQISMESFRKPNFPLISDLLVWLAKRFDPDVDIPLEIDTEDERVKLIRNVAQFMALKANIKLNTKKLYQADGYSVRELLKITGLLYDALSVNLEENDENDIEEDNVVNFSDFDISDKITDLKLSRQLASEITTTGATLFDLLGKEVDLRAARQKSIGRQFEVSEVEAGVQKAIEAINQETAQVNELIGNVAATESSLDAKIERRKLELDRYEKRLQTLKKVRPAFLEEFTAFEQELEQLFVQYSIRLRCLNQLEKQFSDCERIQLEKQLQAATSPRVPTIPLDESDLLLQGQGDHRQERPRASTAGRKKTFGSMQPPPMSGSQSSLDLSSESETDDLFLDKEEPELMHSDDESLALELSNVDRAAPSGRKTGTSKVMPPEPNSDDDF
ncbi:clusterin-associated protein 1 [Anthonomus grandis grandis]|uniref:clusterin-associated protein 1 n=1 Tax=Anthonomus grandis grandis TaxID=2921223 RepID=UPI0021651D50|nr:clusterin-associated protein 1 [Anthonomus grandis grandis]